MRWPFSLLFPGRRDAAAADAAAGDAAAADAAGSAVSADAAASAASAPVPAGPPAWRALPPVQRTIGDAPLIAPAIPFGRELAGRHPPELFLRPLAHDVAADGPAGLVSGIAAPLATPVSAAAALTGHVEAPVRLPAAATAQRRARSASVATLPVRGRETAGEQPPAEAPEAGLSPEPVLPERALPVVAPASVAPALAATRIAEPTTPPAVRALAPALPTPVQRSEMPPAGAGAMPPPAAEAAPAEPEAVTAATEPGPTPAAAPEAPVTAPLQRRTLGESRRLGLGAPLAARSDHQPVPGMGPAMPLARTAAVGSPGPVRSEALALRPAAAAPAALPVLRPAAPAPAPAPAPTAPQLAAPAESAEAAPAAPAPTVPEVEPAGAAVAGEPPGAPGGAAAPDRPLVGEPGRLTISRLADAGAAGEAPGEPGSDRPVATAGAGLPLAAPAGADRSVSAADVGFAAELSAAGSPPAEASPAPVEAGSAAAPVAGPSMPSAEAAPAPPASPSAFAAPPAAPGAPVAFSGPAPSPATTAPLVVSRAMRPPGAPLQPTTGARISAAPPPVVAARRTPAGADALASSSSAPDLVAPGPGRQLAGGVPLAGGPAGERVIPSPDVAGVQRLPVADGGVPLELPAFRALSVSDAPLTLRSVARPQAPGETSAPVPPLVAGSPIVSRLADEARPHPPELGPVPGWSSATGFDRLPAAGGQALQRSVTVGEVSSEVAPAEAAGGGAAGGGGAPDDDELADRVYDRIRARFATELLLDRERMGLLIDG